MSILLNFFAFTVLFIITSALLLSVLISVPYWVCMCPSLISVFPMGNEYCAFMYNQPHYDSNDDAITDFITLAKINIGPFKSLPSLLPK